jgi:hypothetical protein
MSKNAAHVFAAAAIAVAITSATAQAPPSKRPAGSPTQTQIDRVMQSVMLCRWEATWTDGKAIKEAEAVMAFLEANAGSSNHDGVLRGRFDLFGQTFSEVTITAWGKASSTSSWSETASFDALARAIGQRGHDLKPGQLPWELNAKPKLLSATMRTADVTTSLYLMQGRFEGQQSIRWMPGGVTILCLKHETPAEEAQAMLGVPPARVIAEVVKTGEQKPKEWVDAIVEKSDQDGLFEIAGYNHLDAGQRGRLLQRGDPEVHRRLVSNTAITLSAAEIDAVIDKRQAVASVALLQDRYSSLNATQLARLRQDKLTRRYAILRSGDAQAVSLIAQTIKSGDEAAAQEALAFLPGLSNDVVDLILAHGTQAMRRNLTFNSDFKYTPGQIERILADPATEVQIGLLRRPDVSLSDVQIARGIDHPNEDLAFWYRRREGYTPTAQQIESGLTSGNAVTRRSWALNSNIPITPEQAQRGLRDPDSGVRVAFLARSDAQLTEAQFDECTIEEDVGMRFTCVRRADYPLTQKRFEQIVGDANKNVLRFFLERKDAPPVDLTPFVDQALQAAGDAILIEMANNIDVPFTDDQLKRGAASSSTQVKKAFCKRKPAMCKT